MAVNTYIESILEKSIGQSWRNTWIVDDIFNPNEKSGVREGVFDGRLWVKLIRANDHDVVPVRYLLADESLTSLSASTDESGNQLGIGRAYHVDWNRLITIDSKHETSANYGGRIWLLAKPDYTGLIRNENVERAVKTEYERIVSEIKEMPIPSSEQFSSYKSDCSYPIILRVLNVGQGDSIIIKFSDDRYWMIDAYFTAEAVDFGKIKLGNLLELNDVKQHEQPFDRLILSHLHYDHIKSATDVIDLLNPRIVLVKETRLGITTTALSLLKYASENGLLRLLSSMEINHIGNAELKCIPTSILSKESNSKDPNHHGIIVTIMTDKSHILLPGDVSGNQLEELMLLITEDIQDKIKHYKVTHHCSKTGNNARFLHSYSPTYAYTSCAEKNRYNLPDVITKLAIEAVATSHEFTFSSKIEHVVW